MSLDFQGVSLNVYTMVRERISTLLTLLLIWLGIGPAHGTKPLERKQDKSLSYIFMALCSDLSRDNERMT